MRASFTPRRLVLLLALAALAVIAMQGGLDQTLAAKRQAWSAQFWPWLWGESAFYLGQGAVQITPLALLTIWGFWKRRAGAASVGLASLSAVVFSGLVVQAVKHLVCRPRPRLFGAHWEPLSSVVQMDLNSFPSGHSSTTFALAGVLACRWPGKAWLFYLLAAFVAAGRVASGAHHVSDCAAGAIVGLVMGWILGAASRQWGRTEGALA